MSKQQPFVIDDITALDVLGMLIKRQRNDGIPPCLLCMSQESRAEIRAAGSAAVELYRESERQMEKLRAEGNPRAFFAW